MQGVGLWRMMELSPCQHRQGDMVTLRVWSGEGGLQECHGVRGLSGTDKGRGALPAL